MRFSVFPIINHLINWITHLFYTTKEQMHRTTGNSKTDSSKLDNNDLGEHLTGVAPSDSTFSDVPMFNFVMSKKGDPSALKQQQLDYFDTFLGPATAVNMFATSGFEKTFVSSYNAGEIKGKKTFIGGSFGAFRFCALLGTVLSGVDHVTPFHKHVIGMTYRKGDTPAVLLPMLDECRNIVASDEIIESILASEQFTLGIVVARLKPCTACCGTGVCLKVCLAKAACCNLCCRCSQGYTYSRLLFHTGAEPPTCCPAGHFSEYHPLNKKNFRHVLQATSMIPGVTPPIKYIEGVGHGSYIDAALSDFQVGFRVADGYRALVPTAVHTTKDISRTMMDSFGCCHQIPSSLLDNTCVIHPTAAFRKIVSPSTADWEENSLPTLNDWFNKEFVKTPEIRQRFWKTTKELSESHWTFGTRVGLKENAINADC